MDWGLLRSKEKGKFMLRDKFVLPAWYYYQAILTNFILRFSWVATLFVASMPQWVTNSQALIFMLCLAEGYRRA